MDNKVSRFGEFEAELKAKANERRVPVHGKVSLTYRCPLNCVHCYCNEPPNAAITHQEVSAALMTEIFGQMSAAGCMWVTLTGGEPLLREDFSEIYRAAYKQGFFISVFTNATLIDDGAEALLRECPPRRVEVSVYGADAETYEKITRRKGSFGRCLQGIERLRRIDIRVVAKTPILTLNIRQIPDIRKLCESLGLELDLLPTIYPRMDGDQTPLQYRPSPRESAGVFLANTRRQKVRGDVADMAARHGRARSSGGNLFCSAGRSEFHISPYGRLGLCSLLSRPGYTFDVTNGTFEEGWRRLRELADSMPPMSPAARPDDPVSFQCAVKSFLEHSDFSKRVRFLDSLRDRIAEAINEPDE